MTKTTKIYWENESLEFSGRLARTLAPPVGLRKRTGLFIKRFGVSAAGFGLNHGLLLGMMEV